MYRRVEGGVSRVYRILHAGCVLSTYASISPSLSLSSFGRINKTGDAPCDDLIYLPCAGDRGNHFRDADISSSGVSSLEAREGGGGGG